MQAVYGLPAKSVGYMSFVWAERRYNTETLRIARQLWVIFLLSGSFISVFSVLLFKVYYLWKTRIKLKMYGLSTF